MASVMQLGYLGLSVKDPGAWESFATELLGLQVSGKTDGGGFFLRMDEHHHRFVVEAGEADDVAFIGWEVADQAALRELVGQLKAAGIEVNPGSAREAKERRVVELIRFSDPSGIASEAYFGPLMDYANPFKSPRPISGFETGVMGLGHAVIRVDDPPASLGFYRDVLGMRVSDFIDLKMRRDPETTASITFLHCNPRHHSLAFLQAPGRKRLFHFMLQVKSIDDVGSTDYLAQDMGVEISGTLGRHTNDHMMSFYMRSPSGFEIE